VDAVTVPARAVHLVDGSLYVFRAWHSMPDQFHDADGHPVNAVHGYTRFLCELLEKTGA
jgi:5'-3' exonuclease